MWDKASAFKKIMHWFYDEDEGEEVEVKEVEEVEEEENVVQASVMEVAKLKIKQLAMSRKEKEMIKRKPAKANYRTLFRGLKFQLGGITYQDEVREYPPSKRTILFEGRANKNKYFVHMPYLVFVRRGNILYLGMAKKPLESGNDEIYFPTVANVYSSHRVCMAFSSKSVVKEAVEDGVVLDTMINYFWQSAADLNGRWTGRKAIAENFGSCEAWEKMELKEVLDKLNFRPVPLKKLAGRNFEFGKVL